MSILPCAPAMPPASSASPDELSIEDRAGLHCLDDAFQFVLRNFSKPSSALKIIGDCQRLILKKKSFRLC